MTHLIFRTHLAGYLGLILFHSALIVATLARAHSMAPLPAEPFREARISAEVLDHDQSFKVRIYDMEWGGG